MKALRCSCWNNATRSRVQYKPKFNHTYTNRKDSRSHSPLKHQTTRHITLAVGTPTVLLCTWCPHTWENQSVKRKPPHIHFPCDNGWSLLSKISVSSLDWFSVHCRWLGTLACQLEAGALKSQRDRKQMVRGKASCKLHVNGCIFTKSGEKTLGRLYKDKNLSSCQFTELWCTADVSSLRGCATA